MKKTLIIITVFLLWTSSTILTGCQINRNYPTEKTYSATPTKELVETKEKTITSSSTTKPQTNYNYQKEETKEWYSTTVALSNAIIVEDNHEDNVVYKKKCDSCGYIEPGTFSTNPGSFTGGFYCPNCEEQKTIKLETTYSD